MFDVIRDNLPVFLIAVLVGAVIGYLLLRPRQRVRLTENTPVRPHMPSPARPRSEGRDVVSEAAAATSDVAGEIIGTRVHDHLGGAEAEGDDLQRLKGVGPRLAELLRARGLTRFEQIARLNEAELARLDEELGAFRGRLSRDRVVEQADYLARGDVEGFEARFGKI